MRSTTIALMLTATMSSALALEQRDLPVDHGCTPCNPNDAPFYQSAQQAIAAIDPAIIDESATAAQTVWPATYTPRICAEHPVNCITSGPGVKWTGVGGLSAPLGRWPKQDGSETIAWGYWQSTLQFTGAGGSGTTYNAHCTIFACAKGRMRADIGGSGSVQGDGATSNAAANNCGCFPQDLDADITFSLF